MSADSLARSRKRLERLRQQSSQLDRDINKLQGQCDLEKRYRWLKGAEIICRISLNAINLKRIRPDIPRLESEYQAAKTYETYKALFLAQRTIEQSVENLRSHGLDPNYALLNLPECLSEFDVNAQLEEILRQLKTFDAVNMAASEQMECLLLKRKKLMIEIEKYQRRYDKNLVGG